MKNILTHLTARGALALVAVCATVQSAVADSIHYGNILVSVLTEAGSRDLQLPGRLRVFDTGKVTLMTVTSPYSENLKISGNGALYIDTQFDWDRWQSTPAIPGLYIPVQRTYRGETSGSSFRKSLLAAYGFWQAIFSNEVSTNSLPTDNIFKVASSYNPNRMARYDLARGTTLTVAQTTTGKMVAMVSNTTPGSDPLSWRLGGGGIIQPAVAGRASTISFLEY